MWTIADTQFEKISQSMLEEYMLRVCKYVSDDKEFAWILPERIKDNAKKVLNKRMRYLFKDEKCAAEIVKLNIKYPDILTPPHRRDIRIILDDNKMEQKDKLGAITNYINH